MPDLTPTLSSFLKYLQRRRHLRQAALVAISTCAVFAACYFGLGNPVIKILAEFTCIASALLLMLLSNSLCPHCSHLFTVGPGDWITYSFATTCRNCHLRIADDGIVVADALT